MVVNFTLSPTRRQCPTEVKTSVVSSAVTVPTVTPACPSDVSFNSLEARLYPLPKNFSGVLCSVQDIMYYWLVGWLVGWLVLVEI